MGDGIHNIKIYKYQKEKFYSIFSTLFDVRAMDFQQGKHKLESLRIFLIEHWRTGIFCLDSIKIYNRCQTNIHLE